jgi:hypothetical protein
MIEPPNEPRPLAEVLDAVAADEDLRREVARLRQIIGTAADQLRPVVALVPRLAGRSRHVDRLLAAACNALVALGAASLDSPEGQGADPRFLPDR